MKHTVYFLTNNYSSDSCIPKLDSYDYWEEMVSKLCETATDFEIRCWSDEMPAIESGKKFGKQVENRETLELVFQGRITPGFISELLVNCLTEAGHLKWFTLNLMKGDRMIFHSGHYGTEPYLSDISDAEIDKIKEWTKAFPEILRVDVF